MIKINYAALFGLEVVVDAMVILDLSEISALDLLNAIFTAICIPATTVSKELVNVNLDECLFTFGAITTVEGWDMFRSLKKDYPALSECDRIAIVIAYESNRWCVTNETKMRHACERYGIEYTGTLGILGCAFRKGIVNKDKLCRLLESLEDGTCFLSKSLLAGFKEDIGLDEITHEEVASATEE